MHMKPNISCLDPTESQCTLNISIYAKWIGNKLGIGFDMTKLQNKKEISTLRYQYDHAKCKYWYKLAD